MIPLTSLCLFLNSTNHRQSTIMNRIIHRINLFRTSLQQTRRFSPLFLLLNNLLVLFLPHRNNLIKSSFLFNLFLLLFKFFLFLFSYFSFKPVFNSFFFHLLVFLNSLILFSLKTLYFLFHVISVLFALFFSQSFIIAHISILTVFIVLIHLKSSIFFLHFFLFLRVESYHKLSIS